MVFGRGFAIIALGLVSVLLCGCASTRVQTAMAAERLERRADALAGGFCHQAGVACHGSRYLPAALGLANQAHRFLRTVQNDSDQQVVVAFKRLWWKFQGLRAKTCRSPDRRLRADLKPTAQAFADVQVLVENGYSYADPTVYAMGGYTLDPYYN